MKGLEEMTENNATAIDLVKRAKTLACSPAAVKTLETS
jgi:hypothetical protein